MRTYIGIGSYVMKTNENQQKTSAMAFFVLLFGALIAGASAVVLPPAGVLVCGPGSREVSLIAAKLASAAGYASTAIVADGSQFSSRLLLYGKAYAAAEADDPVALAKGHRAKGYRAAYCPNISLKDPAHIRAVETAFASEDVLIAELHGLVSWEKAGNLIDPDLEQRAAWHEHLCERFALADEVGARAQGDVERHLAHVRVDAAPCGHARARARLLTCLLRAAFQSR